MVGRLHRNFFEFTLNKKASFEAFFYNTYFINNTD
jgi:hypothetical protein